MASAVSVIMIEDDIPIAKATKVAFRIEERITGPLPISAIQLAGSMKTFKSLKTLATHYSPSDPSEGVTDCRFPTIESC